MRFVRLAFCLSATWLYLRACRLCCAARAAEETDVAALQELQRSFAGSHPHGVSEAGSPLHAVDAQAATLPAKPQLDAFESPGGPVGTAEKEDTPGAPSATTALAPANEPQQQGRRRAQDVTDGK